MTDRRPLYVLAVLVVAMLAFAGFSRLDNDSGPSASPAPGGATTTTAEFGRGPENAAGNVSDWEAGVRTITAIENELFREPDPSRVGEIMLTSCTCYKDTESRLAALAASRRHIDGDNIVITLATLIEQTGPNRVEVYVAIRSDGKPTVDASGRVVAPSPGGSVPPLVYTLEKRADGRWLLADRRLHREESA